MELPLEIIQSDDVKALWTQTNLQIIMLVLLPLASDTDHKLALRWPADLGHSVNDILSLKKELVCDPKRCFF